ncbi:hypothetical protein Golax_001359 [Gossypium laxum]|uniref:Uncharacterized protein n=1 Tax=Gossypium laxum TaxID=34288 RepID=A0A7J9AWS2_9ROSI|nr:hypothetical protein [Gossypium laxum]
MVGRMWWWTTVMEEVVVVMEAMVLIAKMEGSLSARFHARFASKRLLIMGIGRGLSFNVGINFIWTALVQHST